MIDAWWLIEGEAQGREERAARERERDGFELKGEAERHNLHTMGRSQTEPRSADSDRKTQSEL